MSHNSYDRNRDELKTIVACIEDAIQNLEDWSIDNDEELSNEVDKLWEILEEIK